jgi:hypothetical protein
MPSCCTTAYEPVLHLAPARNKVPYFPQIELAAANFTAWALKADASGQSTEPTNVEHPAPANVQFLRQLSSPRQEGDLVNFAPTLPPRHRIVERIAEDSDLVAALTFHHAAKPIGHATMYPEPDLRKTF